MGGGAGDPSPDYKATDVLSFPRGERALTSAEAGRTAASISFRRLSTPEEFRASEEVQRAAWGFSRDGAVPHPLQRAFEDNGGIVIGAFAGAELIGISLGFLGREGDRQFHYSHMTGVRPAWQNRHIGFGLKRRQREEVLAQGLDEARWTYDPLQSKNALFNVRRLGGRPDRYYLRYYGTMADRINEGLETDRVRLVWALREPRVEARLHGERPTPAEDLARVHASSALVETALGPTGLRRPATVRPPTADRLQLEIPYDLANVRTRDRGSARRWRELSREAFSLAFAAGYRVDDFATVEVDHEWRSFYFLERPRSSDAA